MEMRERWAEERSPARDLDALVGYGSPRDYYSRGPRGYDAGPGASRLPRDRDRAWARPARAEPSVDGDSRFGDVPYRKVPPDVRRAYERKIRGSSPPREGPFSRPEAPDDERTYFMYPQGFSIQPGKYSVSPPPSYRASAQHPEMRYPSVDEPRGAWEVERPQQQRSFAQHRAF